MPVLCDAKRKFGFLRRPYIDIDPVLELNTTTEHQLLIHITFAFSNDTELVLKYISCHPSLYLLPLFALGRLYSLFNCLLRKFVDESTHVQSR